MKEKIIGYDLMTVIPYCKMDLRDILLCFGLKLNEETNKIEIDADDPILKKFPMVLSLNDQQKQHITQVIREDEDINIFSRYPMDNNELWNQSKYLPYTLIYCKRLSKWVITREISKEESGAIKYLCYNPYNIEETYWINEDELSRNPF